MECKFFQLCFHCFSFFFGFGHRKAYEEPTNNPVYDQNVDTSNGTKKNAAQIMQQRDAAGKKRVKVEGKSFNRWTS
jgi:hypothetical protein